ncbi:MAG: hypothetical protein ABFS35_15305 [Bacteroidota bacterium]
MPDNNTDKIFKKKIEELSMIPLTMKWDKENSWKRLKLKRQQKAIIRLSYYAAAIIIIGLMISNVYLGKIKPLYNQSKSGQYSEMSEFQKRLKLKEIEDKMNRDYTRKISCYTCEDDYLITNNDNRPAKFRYFQTNYN